MNPVLTVIAAAPADEPNTGWGKVLALIVAALLFWAATEAYGRWKATSSGGFSPPAGEITGASAKPQIMAGAGTVSKAPAQIGGKEAAVVAFIEQEGARKATSVLVREANRRFGASKRTVMRAIQKARRQPADSNAE
jgi:hypothetical protein